MRTHLNLAGVAQWQSSGFVNRRLEVQFLSPAPTFQAHSVLFSPGLETVRQRIKPLNWVGKSAMLRNWLTYLKREIEAPDLWASLFQDQELLSSESTEAVNTPFTVDEQVQIKETIEEIRVYITSTYSLG